MKRLFSICLAFSLVALCTAPLFFPNEISAQTAGGQTEQAAPANDSGVAPAPAVAKSPAASEITEATDPVASPLPNDAVTYKVLSTEAPNEVVLVEVPDPAGIFERIWEFFQKNGAAGLSIFLSLLGLVEIIVRFTPSKRDDAAFAWLRKFIDAIIPNLKKGGGTFQAPKA